MELLNVDGMSSEEDGTAPIGHQTVTVFFVKVCPWRANEITQYLKIIDQTGAALAVKARYPSVAATSQGYSKKRLYCSK